MPDRTFDRVVIGGGIVGLATARELLRREPATRLALLEKEPELAAHQSGRNSGVIHSGVYYKPGTLKARLCVEGRAELLRFCDEHGIRYELSGKLIVAVAEGEEAALREIFRRGRANGVEGVTLIGPERIRKHEPAAVGRAALWVPTTGIVDYRAVAAALADEVRGAGGEILTSHRVTGIVSRDGGPILETAGGPIAARGVIACAGLQCDRVAAMSGRADLRIVPFRGDYYVLRPAARHVTRSMIYPVPDPRFPFLGVHLTRRIDGEVWAGPNAVLAFARERYGRWSIRPRDLAATLAWRGFWRAALRYWRTGVAEMWCDHVRRAYLGALRRYVPELRAEDLLPGPSGIRAQAVARNGSLVDDFAILEAGPIIHVLNAPSPAATSALAIAREIADRAEQAWTGR